MLRRATGKRLTQHSDKRIWCGFGVQTQAFSSDFPIGFEIGQICQYLSSLGAGKWEIITKRRGKMKHKFASIVLGAVLPVLFTANAYANRACCFPDATCAMVANKIDVAA